MIYSYIYCIYSLYLLFYKEFKVNSKTIELFRSKYVFVDFDIVKLVESNHEAPAIFFKFLVNNFWNTVNRCDGLVESSIFYCSIEFMSELSCIKILVVLLKHKWNIKTNRTECSKNVHLNNCTIIENCIICY